MEKLMAWNDPASRRQMQMIWSLKSQLGLDPDLSNMQQINKRQAQMLISGLLDEVNALEGRCPTCGQVKAIQDN